MKNINKKILTLTIPVISIVAASLTISCSSIVATGQTANGVGDKYIVNHDGTHPEKTLQETQTAKDKYLSSAKDKINKEEFLQFLGFTINAKSSNFPNIDDFWSNLDFMGLESGIISSETNELNIKVILKKNDFWKFGNKNKDISIHVHIGSHNHDH